ncbi:DUF2637 domain-containing protein [Fodinicola feengrottensis]|uniref:DUF2637 domain-containing protein n=1 Tax=Fodinicola feengrottensis TaxID=435914 RepID=UPI0031DD08A2
MSAEQDDRSLLRGPFDGDLWLRRFCGCVVAAVAAYASYQHQRMFAAMGGADSVSASLWPLAVDGLLLLATRVLLKSNRGMSWRTRLLAWIAFILGIAVSLASNIAAAPEITWQAVLVAGWPPVALLLSVELLGGRRAETRGTAKGDSLREPNSAEVNAHSDDGTGADLETVVANGEAPMVDSNQTCDAGSMRDVGAEARPAHEVMWDYFCRQRAVGHTPNGVELDKVAGTRDYGRSVIRRWKEEGRLAGKHGDSSETGGYRATSCRRPQINGAFSSDRADGSQGRSGQFDAGHAAEPHVLSMIADSGLIGSQSARRLPLAPRPVDGRDQSHAGASAIMRN